MASQRVIYYGLCEDERNNRIFRVERGPCDFYSLDKFNVSHSGLMMKSFCNYLLGSLILNPLANLSFAHLFFRKPLYSFIFSSEKV